ncbi:MAG: hypothetical protein AB8B91_10695 [Rubripirellula sp.]
MSAIAILRSTKRGIARTDAQQSARAGRAITEGLYQRSIAILRTNPASSGTITDRAGSRDAFAEVRNLGPTATQIQVFLYAGSSIPAKDVIVDPTAL